MALAQTEPGPAAINESNIEYSANREIGWQSLEQLCTPIDSVPPQGLAFDGTAVPQSAMELKPGRYSIDNGAGLLVLYPDARYLLQIPIGADGIRRMTGTNGPDLFRPDLGVVGGCSVEQLSEAMTKNGVSLSTLEPVSLFPESSSTYGQPEIDEFCANRGNQPIQPGVQFDGIAANSRVIQLVYGRYAVRDSGFLLLFPNNSYFLKLPSDAAITYGSYGNDWLLTGNSGNMLGGCSVEQLSEVLVNNGIPVNSLELVHAYD